MNSNLDFLTGGDAKPYRADVIGKGALIQGDCLEVMQWLIENIVKFMNENCKCNIKLR